MSREIKFRAIYKPDIALGGGKLEKGLIFYQQTIDGTLWFISGLDPDCRYPFEVPFLDSDWIVEQFTGLYDKNGKEIYEGDILSGVLGTAGRGAESRREKGARFIVEWIRDGYNLSAIDHYMSSSYRWYPNYQDCEVIGNIHENPELLKGDTP